MSTTTEYNFTESADYSYNSSLIELSGGTVALKLNDNPGQDFTETFDSDTGFTYDNTKSEFSGGQVQQKDTRPADALHYTSFTSNENNVWPAGQSANSLLGGAVVADGRCDLTSGGSKRLYMPGSNGFDTVGTAGCIRWTYRPNYTGAPGATYQILEYDSATGNNNAIFIAHNNSYISIDLRDSSGASHWMYTPAMNSFVAGTDYNFELNFDFSGTSRFFVDGVLKASIDTSAWSRAAQSGQFEWGGASGSGNFYIDDIIVFDAVQHTSDFSGSLPFSYNETTFVESDVILPEMEYTGAGTLIEFDVFSVTETNSPRYTLQVGRSGDYLYYNGSSWVVSDGTYSQANDSTTFNANLATLDINGEIYGQFKILFPDSNTQSATAELTASLTAQIYSTTNPLIKPVAYLGAEEIVSILSSYTQTGNDAIKWILDINGVNKYWDGSAWSNSTSYTESNTLDEINTNISTLLTLPDIFRWGAYLHSDTGVTSPSINTVSARYEYYAGNPDEPQIVKIYGWIYNGIGEAEESVTITAELTQNYNIYTGNDLCITDGTYTTTTDSNGYWSISLVETENIDARWSFTFSKGNTKKAYIKDVPNVSTGAINFSDLE